MRDVLGLDTLAITSSVHETVTKVALAAELASSAPRPPCPTCRSSDKLEPKGLAAAAAIWDTPMRGKPVEIAFRGRRWACRRPGCGTFTDRGPEVHGKHGVTWRLFHHIQALSLKRGISDIVRLTGPEKPVVRPIVMDLAHRLAGRRFDTPRVVAIDDWRPNKKRRFTVISDGESGRALAIVERLDAKGIGEKLHDVIDPSKAKVFVTDLGSSNLALAKSSFKGVPHVADKWHVLQKAQQIQSRVINLVVDELRKTGRTPEAAELISWKPRLDGWNAAAEAKARKNALAGKPPKRPSPDQDVQPALNLTTRLELVRRYPDVQRVYHARLMLRHVYRATTGAAAEAALDRYFAICSKAAIPAPMASLVETLKLHREAILNHQRHAWRHHDDRWRGPTTNQAEMRNGKIKELWRRSRGLRDADYLNMRVVYEGDVLGVTLIACREPECSAVEGPFPLRTALARAALPVDDPAAHRCLACRRKAVADVSAA